MIEICGWSDPERDARLVNLSVRGQTLPGEGRLIAGFVVQGSGSIPIAIRALGPTLSDYGILQFIEQPILKIFTENEPAKSVEDWIHTGVLGVVGSSYWPESILEPLEVVLQGSGSVSIHAIDQTGVNGTVLIDLTVLKP